MGKRKSTSKLVKVARPKLDTTFDCLFCNHEKTVSVTMSRDVKIGHLACKTCRVSYEARINKLSLPIDVYSEWIDACDELKRREAEGLPLEEIHDNEYDYDQDPERDDAARYAEHRNGRRHFDADSEDEVSFHPDQANGRISDNYDDVNNYFSGGENSQDEHGEAEYDEEPGDHHSKPVKRGRLDPIYSDD